MSESISKETEPRGNLLFPRPCSRPVSSPSESPNWYRSAVFYEVLIQAFSDSNGDGVGDFQGLISRLDYLAWLYHTADYIRAGAGRPFMPVQTERRQCVSGNVLSAQFSYGCLNRYSVQRAA